jgi:succinyl-CoA synthetase alpha subunit
VASAGREGRLLEIVRGAGLRMVGPNSWGVLNTAAEVSLNTTFTGAIVRAGGLAIGSQSGGLGLLGHAAARQLGVSMFVSVGDRADVSTNDLLEWCEQDERTAAVMLYVETFGNPDHFTRIARRVSRKKPILALKGRRSGTLAGSEPRSDTAAALRELILRFTLLLAQVPEVVEVDLNPVRCMTSGCLVLDMRLRIEHRRPIDRVKTW